MGDLLHSTVVVLAQNGSKSITTIEPPAQAIPQYVAYRPSTAEVTPPASPQTPNLRTAQPGFGSQRSRHPVQLQMDTAVAPAYERPMYSPSPTGSPTLPPTSLPSPKFPLRQRAPSLLRHAAVPSAERGDNTGAEPVDVSPLMAPTMMRQYSGPGALGPRTFFNPLSSNPVNSSGPAWDSSSEDLPAAYRPRGMTSSSQASFQSTPPLRSVTSTPDYGQYRRGERANLSGTYKPNRGVPNWSHTDYYPPPRPFRGEELRASFRSGWTNASSSFMEASGTERSSMVTARSSVTSERQNSIYSRDPSRDRLRDEDDSPEMSQIFETPKEDDLDDVGDVLDSYFYDEDDQDRNPKTLQRKSLRLSRSAETADTEPPALSQTPSRDRESLGSFQSSENFKQWADQPVSHVNSTKDNHGDKAPLSTASLSIRPASINGYPGSIHVLEDDVLNTNPTDGSLEFQRLSPLQIDPFQSRYQAGITEPNARPVSKTQSGVWQRSSEDLPRQGSVSIPSTQEGPAPTDSAMPEKHQGHRSKTSTAKMTEIRREMSGLPQLHMKKARMSRQDWAEIEAYSNRHSNKPSISRTISNDSTVSKGPLSPPPHPPQISEPLPEVDEDEAIPRRASTSVFDRRSALFNLGVMFPPGAGAEGNSSKVSLNQYRKGLAPIVRKPVAVVERDRYGFKKASDKISVQQYNAWASKYEEHIIRRRNKWIALMSKQGLPTTEPTKFPEMCEKVKRYARKGYPPEWRGAMWWYYSGGQHLIRQKEMVGLYASLVARVNRDELNKDDKDAIERDLDRTFPDNIHFRPEAATDLLDGESNEPSLIKDLREVLSCFALNNPNIGYCQSLNFIAGLLLLFLKQDKERAFVLLTIITRNHLPGAHARNLANTEVNVLMMLIKDYLPKVWASINDTDLINSGPGSNAHPSSKFQRQPTVALSCTSWFMSIFVGVLPIETVLRVWDSFLYEGPRALYRYALAIFKLGEADIKQYRPGDGELFMTVQNLPRTCLDPNILHDLAFVKKGFGQLSQDVIDQKRLFWREQNKITHQISVKDKWLPRAPTSRDEDEDTDSIKKAMGMTGLRRRASRRFRKLRG